MPMSAERVLSSIVPATQNARMTGGKTAVDSVASWASRDSSASEPRTTSTETLGQRCRSRSGSVHSAGKP